MTIQEAIKSGKPFRRPGPAMAWLIVGKHGFVVNPNGLGDTEVRLSTDALTATDWEIKHEPVTIWVNVWGESRTPCGFYKSKEEAELRGGHIAKTVMFVEVAEPT